MSKLSSGNKICSRLCVEMTGCLNSPLSIGSGEDEYSDADVVVSAKGEPYIPGSSLAGALRDYTLAVKGEAFTTGWFGQALNGSPGEIDDRQSRIFIYDAVLKRAKIKLRDGVKLNEHKTAVPMGKYELQFIERGASVKCRVEIIVREDYLTRAESLEAVWAEALSLIRSWQIGFAAGELRIGQRSRRGFGSIELAEARVKKFDMSDKHNYEEWLDWDWEQSDAFSGVGSEELLMDMTQAVDQRCLEHCLEVPLCIPGTLLVRTYAIGFTKTGDLADYEQLTTGTEKQALIPGSSWAGTFRSQIAKIVKELAELPDWEAAQSSLCPLFGTWVEAGGDHQSIDLRASRIIFEDTVVDGGHGLPTTRIAVDRFTGGTVEGALYKEVPWVGGSVRLIIRWKKDEEENINQDELTDQQICGVLLWAIKDLQSGILAVGGETAVGRGLCKPQQATPELRFDGQVIDAEEQQQLMKAAAEWILSIKQQERGKVNEQV